MLLGVIVILCDKALLENKIVCRNSLQFLSRCRRIRISVIYEDDKLTDTSLVSYQQKYAYYVFIFANDNQVKEDVSYTHLISRCRDNT